MDLDNLNIRLGSTDYSGSFPAMYGVERVFRTQALRNVRERIESQFGFLPDLSGKKIAVTAGSRGIADLVTILTSTVALLMERGASVIIVPAMGSHGGATAEGQLEVLESYGISESALGVPIVSDMTVVELGRTDSGMSVFIDRAAYECDGIVVVNKIKPHADFKGDHESGLVKMMAIGLGKHRGAVSVHKEGFASMARLLPQFADTIVKEAPILCGIAIIEDQKDQLYDVEVIPPERIVARERDLLETAKSLLPTLPFDAIDVLVVEEIGKNISGEGMDPNVTGRPGSGLNDGFVAPAIDKIVVFRVTPESHGNGVGIGMADISTVPCANSLDLNPMYINVLTTGSLAPAKIPLLAENDEEALRLAISSANGAQWDTCRIVWIKNTLELERIYVSESLVQESRERGFTRASPIDERFLFDAEGQFLGFGTEGTP